MVNRIEKTGMDDLPCVLLERILLSPVLSNSSDRKRLRLVCHQFDEFITATISTLTALPTSEGLSCVRAGERFPALTTVRLEQLTQSAGIQTINKFLLPSSRANGLRVECVSTGGFKGRWGKRDPDTEYFTFVDYQRMTPLHHVTRFELHVGQVASLRECPPIPSCMSSLTKLSDLSISERGYGFMRDSDLQELPRIQQLTRLRIAGRCISYRSVLHVRQLHQLQVLSLKNCANIGDTGVDILRTVESLQCLDLSGTGVRCGGVKRLVDLPKLQVLGLHDTAVQRNGVVAVLTFPSLRVAGVEIAEEDSLNQLLQDVNIRIVTANDLGRLWMGYV